MPKKLLPALMVIIGVVLAACASPPPDIALSLEYADLGEVANGEIRTIEVEVLNSGGAPLQIEQISTSCGCTTAEVEPRTIAPGSSAILRITFDSGAHGPDFQGPIRRAVFLSSNDPDEAEIILTLEAVIRSPD
jgi:hypothetical protein